MIVERHFAIASPWITALTRWYGVIYKPDDLKLQYKISDNTTSAYLIRPDKVKPSLMLTINKSFQGDAHDE